MALKKGPLGKIGVGWANAVFVAKAFARIVGNIDTMVEMHMVEFFKAPALTL